MQVFQGSDRIRYGADGGSTGPAGGLFTRDVSICFIEEEDAGLVVEREGGSVASYTGDEKDEGLCSCQVDVTLM